MVPCWKRSRRHPVPGRQRCTPPGPAGSAGAAAGRPDGGSCFLGFLVDLPTDRTPPSGTPPNPRDAAARGSCGLAARRGRTGRSPDVRWPLRADGRDGMSVGSPGTVGGQRTVTSRSRTRKKRPRAANPPRRGVNSAMSGGARRLAMPPHGATGKNVVDTRLVFRVRPTVYFTRHPVLKTLAAGRDHRTVRHPAGSPKQPRAACRFARCARSCVRPVDVLVPQGVPVDELGGTEGKSDPGVRGST